MGTYMYTILHMTIVSCTLDTCMARPPFLSPPSLSDLKKEVRQHSDQPSCSPYLWLQGYQGQRSDSISMFLDVQVHLRMLRLVLK